MYRKILVALENGPADEALVPHVAGLARMCGAELLLLHVADGWAARHFDQLKLAESEEMLADRDYLAQLTRRLAAEGLQVSAQLAAGDPPAEILRVAEAEQCDLIAMASHGHRLFKDIVLGTTIDPVRHRAQVPVLLVRAPRK
ncbi:MAG TPA: universal stress protein [Candidatus Krumholzibacteria bacterium]|nr:universal stress protein [Candidatus Krumholzibacteria bacterium]